MSNLISFYYSLSIYRINLKSKTCILRNAFSYRYYRSLIPWSLVFFNSMLKLVTSSILHVEAILLTVMVAKKIKKNEMVEKNVSCSSYISKASRSIYVVLYFTQRSKRQQSARKIILNGTVNSEQWTVNSEQWTVNREQWTVNSEQWTVNSEQWTCLLYTSPSPRD